MAHLKKYLLVYTLTSLVALMVATSFYRFMVLEDYTLGYEGECDPYTESCYVYCEDEECTDPFYYSWIERNAGLLHAQCGELVTECDAAYVCENNDDSCAIYFCDETVEECDILTEADIPAEMIIESTI